MNIKQHILNLFTGKDNVTLDLGRILWAKGALVYNALAIYSVVHTHNFDFIAYGTGFAWVLAAGGAALAFKQGTEPNAPH
jgi:hypothetical protein